MDARLKHPGQELLDRVEAELARAARGEAVIADADRGAAVLSACARAHAGGLSLAGRLAALKAWVAAAESMATPDLKGFGRITVDPTWCRKAAEDFFGSGLSETLLLADAATIDRCCRLVDLMGSGYVFSEGSDQATARATAEDVIQKLPLLPERIAMGRVTCSHETESEVAGLWPLMTRIVDEAIDPHVVQLGREMLLGDAVIRAHHRAASADAASAIGKLEAIERALDEEFGDLLAQGAKSTGAAVLGAALGVFASKATKEAEAERDKRRSEWMGRVTAAAGVRMFGRKGYIDAYATFLEARIDAVHGEIAKAIKNALDAVERGFDPERGVSVAAQLLAFRNREDEARALLARWIPLVDGAFAEADRDRTLLVQGLEKLGGSLASVDFAAAAKSAADAAARNAQQRAARAAQLASEGDARRTALLRDWEGKGVALVDAAVDPAAYDLAVTSGASDRVVRIDAAAASRLCLDETPLFAATGPDRLVRLAGDGLPAAEAGRYGIELAEALAARDQLAWGDVAKRTPNLYRSPRYAERLVDRALGAGSQDDAAAMLRHFREGKILEEPVARGFFERLVAAIAPAKGDDAAAKLGESLLPLFTGEHAARIRADAVRRLLALAAAEKSVYAKVGFLDRAAAADPENADVRTRRAAARSARMKKTLAIAGAVAGAIGIAWAVVQLKG